MPLIFILLLLNQEACKRWTKWHKLLLTKAWNMPVLHLVISVWQNHSGQNELRIGNIKILPRKESVQKYVDQLGNWSQVCHSLFSSFFHGASCHFQVTGRISKTFLFFNRNSCTSILFYPSHCVQENYTIYYDSKESIRLVIVIHRSC